MVDPNLPVQKIKAAHKLPGAVVCVTVSLGGRIARLAATASRASPAGRVASDRLRRPCDPVATHLGSAPAGKTGEDQLSRDEAKARSSFRGLL